MTAPISADVSGWEDAWRACYSDIPHLNTVGLNGAEWPDRAYCCDYFFVSADLVDRVESVAVDQLTAASAQQPAMLTLVWSNNREGALLSGLPDFCLQLDQLFLVAQRVVDVVVCAGLELGDFVIGQLPDDAPR